jgi:transcriptional regulator with XRE-family HTH domain
MCVDSARIIEQRRARVWTQSDLAEAAGISVRTVSNVENGKRVSAPTIQLIANALGLSAANLRPATITDSQWMFNVQPE